MDALNVRLLNDEQSLAKISPLRFAWIKEETDMYIEQQSVLCDLIRAFRKEYDFFLGELNDRAVGYGVASSRNGIYYSDGIFVDPRFRGRGVGSAIKRAQVDYAISKGYPSLVSIVGFQNEPSMRLQEKVGAVLADLQDRPGHHTYVLNLTA